MLWAAWFSAYDAVAGIPTGILIGGDAREAVDGGYMVFGHHPVSGELFIWRSEDNTNWSEAVVATGLPGGSEIRSVTSFQAGLIAVGINAETFNTLVWTAPDGNHWRQTAVITTR